MGSFIVHAIPGTIFLLFGLWWSVKYPLKYLYKKKKNAYLLDSKGGFQRPEVTEGIIKVIIAIIGIISHQFIPSGPHLKLYNYETKQWDHLMNWQHATIYLFYGISGLADILVHSTKRFPMALERMMLSNSSFYGSLPRPSCFTCSVCSVEYDTIVSQD